MKIQEDRKNRRSLFLSGLTLAAVSAVAAAVLCSARVELRRQDVLATYGSSVSAWLEGTAASVSQWNEEQRAQRLRISNAETYRLFAGDLFGLENAEGEHAPSAAMIAEEVPTIRKILKEYMDFSGMTDARIIGAGGVTLLSSQSAPAPLSAAQQNAARLAMASGKSVRLPVRGSGSGLFVDVFEPMHSLDAPEKIVAAFMGTHPVLPGLTQFAARPKPEELSEAFFLQRGTNFEASNMAQNAPTAPAWQVVTTPAPKALEGALAQELESASGLLKLALRPSVSTLGEVYSASFAVPGTGLSVLLETPSAVLEQRVFKAALPIYLACGLGWAAFLLVCLQLWWYAAGRQQKALTQKVHEFNQLVSLQKEFLDRVNVSLDMGLLMVDVKGQIHVCNRAFAQVVQGREEELSGQMIYNVLPAKAAAELVDRVRQVALKAGEDSYEVWLDAPAEGGEVEPRLFRVTLSPFLDSAEENRREARSGAVVTLKDVTEFRRRAERARLQQRRLIEAFTSVEASADPYLHGFSLRMADLAERVALSMGLSEDSRNTLVMSAQLSQLGKLFVPRDLLTKQGRLTDEELAEVRRAPEHAARVLSSVDFDLPIARALHEMYENLDGSGYPRGLKGEEILFEARLLGVLNAYCAMVSDRAYRQGMSVSAALAQLRGNPRYEQSLVDALEKVVDEKKF